MRIQEKIDHTYKIEISSEERVLYSNVLNEVLHDMKIDSIEDRIAPRAQIEELFDRISTAKQEDEYFQYSSIGLETDVKILKFSTLELLRNFSVYEFHTRLGVSLKDILDILGILYEIEYSE